MGEDKSVLRWGGLAGLLAGVLFIVGFVIVLASTPASLLREPQTIADFEEEVLLYPEFGAARTAGFSLFLAAVILAMALFLVLYRALRKTSPASAFFGSILGILGLVMLLTFSLLDIVVFPTISNLYLSAATDQERTSVVVLLPFLRGIVIALGIALGIFVSAGFISLGAAMVGSDDFGRGFGWVSAGFGVVGFGALTSLLLGFTGGGQFPFILLLPFLLLLGWKVFSLSRVAEGGGR